MTSINYIMLLDVRAYLGLIIQILMYNPSAPTLGLFMPSFFHKITSFNFMNFLGNIV